MIHLHHTYIHLQIPGVHSIHELHIWRLNQHKSLASVHVVVSDPSVISFLQTARTINECFHAYGIHSTTLQPEVVSDAQVGMYHTGNPILPCQIVCGDLCGVLTCCG